MRRFLDLFTQSTLQWIIVIVVFVWLFFVGWYKTNNGFLNVVLWLFVSTIISVACISIVRSEFAHEIVFRIKRGTREHGMRYFLHQAQHCKDVIRKFFTK